MVSNVFFGHPDEEDVDDACRDGGCASPGDRVEVSLPGRVNMLGNPADGMEGAHATISMAIEPRATVSVTMTDPGEVATASFEDTDPLPIPAPTPLERYAILHDTVAYLDALIRSDTERWGPPIPEKGYVLEARTEIPRQSGLGGSASIIGATLIALREAFGLSRVVFNDYMIAEMAKRVETDSMGISAGYSDRYITVFGGLRYIDYTGKLHWKGLDEEPLATIEDLTDIVGPVPIGVVYSGVEHSSTDFHTPFRKAYMEEHRWITSGRTGSPPEHTGLVEGMGKVGLLAGLGKKAMLQKDWHLVAELMNQNHELVDGMLTSIGFSDGIGEVNRSIRELTLEAGALAAKLTGAGGGGSVFFVFEPERRVEVELVLRAILGKGGHHRARVFLPESAAKGARITRSWDD